MIQVDKEIIIKLPLEKLSDGDPVNHTVNQFPSSAVVLLPLPCDCLLGIRPSVRLGVVPSSHFRLDSPSWFVAKLQTK